MKAYRHSTWTRREVLSHLAAAAGTGLLGLGARVASADSPLETTRIRLVKIPSICMAPQYMAEELLETESFTDIQYIEKPGTLGSRRHLPPGRPTSTATSRPRSSSS